MQKKISKGVERIRYINNRHFSVTDSMLLTFDSIFLYRWSFLLYFSKSLTFASLLKEEADTLSKTADKVNLFL